MLESKAPIIPVFYHVKPAELRWTRGKKRSYAEALEKLTKRKTEVTMTLKLVKRSCGTTPARLKIGEMLFLKLQI
jgi:hypothetical protein